MTTFLIFVVVALGGIWAVETLLFLLSYRHGVRAEDASRSGTPPSPPVAR